MSGATVEHILKTSRSAIIDLLKANGSMSVEQLAESLGVSKVCVRRHLGVLESDGLIEYEPERHERGRPRHLYRLTEKARCLFPQRYDELAREVMGQIEQQFGAAALVQVLRARADEWIEQLMGELEGLPFEERVRALAKMITARGYLAESRRQKDGSFRLRKRHCPTEKVAVRYPQLCDEEVRVYREVIGGTVTRECRIADGHRVCEFLLAPPVLTQIVGHLASQVVGRRPELPPDRLERDSPPLDLPLRIG
jgi:predicted ArsR family transcriptional regulator